MDPRGRARAIQEAWPGWRLGRLFTDQAGLRVGGAGPSPAPGAAGMGVGAGRALVLLVAARGVRGRRGGPRMQEPPA